MTGWVGHAATLAEAENASPEAVAYRVIEKAVRDSRDVRILRARDVEENARDALTAASAAWAATRDSRDAKATSVAWTAVEVARVAHVAAKAGVGAARDLLRHELVAQGAAARVAGLARAKTDDSSYATLLASLAPDGTADAVAEIGARICDTYEVLSALVPDVQTAIRANVAAREQLLALARSRGANTAPDSLLGRLCAPLTGGVEALAEAAVLAAIHDQLRAYVHACGLNPAAGRLVTL